LVHYSIYVSYDFEMRSSKSKIARTLVKLQLCYDSLPKERLKKQRGQVETIKVYRKKIT